MKSHVIIGFHFTRGNFIAQIHDPLASVFSRSFFPVPIPRGRDTRKHITAPAIDHTEKGKSATKVDQIRPAFLGADPHGLAKMAANPRYRQT